jgi:hypothetical protein
VPVNPGVPWNVYAVPVFNEVEMDVKLAYPPLLPLVLLIEFKTTRLINSSAVPPFDAQ